MDFDVEVLYNIHNLQESKSIEDQKRLLNLLNVLSSNDGWPICASILLASSSDLPNPYTLPDSQKSSLIFLCCRAIEDFLHSKGFIDPINGQRQPKYLEAKASQLISIAILRYYPKYWSSVFDDLILLINEVTNKQSSLDSVYVVVEIVLDVLIDLDASIISRDLQLTTDELRLSNEIKDAMRMSSIESFITTFYQLMHRFLNCETPNANLMKKILCTVGLYAAWVDLGLVAGAEWVSLLNRLLEIQLSDSSNALIRSGVYSYLTGIINKGMGPIDKLKLVTGVWNQLGTELLNDALLTSYFEHSEVHESVDICDSKLESFCGLTKLIDSTGIQLIDVYRSLHESTLSGNLVPNGIHSDNDTSSLMAIALENIEVKLNFAIRLFEHKGQQISHNLIPFLRGYLCFLKSGSNNLTPHRKSRNSSTSMDSPGSLSIFGPNGASSYPVSGLLELTEARLRLIKNLLFALINKLKSLPLFNGQVDDEDDYEDYRHDLRTLIGNVIQIDSGFVLDLIHQMIKHARDMLNTNRRADETILAHIDVTFNMFYLFGEICKAPKNDYFAQTFMLHETMIAIMSILCSDNFSRLPHWSLQLQYFEIMTRYEHYFLIAPNHLFCVMLAFVDDRGLHSSCVSVRVRCAYLITRLVKAHRKTLAPHTEELLSRFSDLLQLSTEPDPSILERDEAPITNGLKSRKPVQQAVLGVTEQGFLYEAVAKLIAVGGDIGNNSVDQLFSALLNPILIQYRQLVTKYINEPNPKMAEARGILIKQATDLITRTSRVFCQSKSVITPGCEGVFIDILHLIVSELARFPTEVTSPGRLAVCAGVRAFFHHMVACINPVNPADFNTITNNNLESDNTPGSNILLNVLLDAVPKLVKPLQKSHPNGQLSDQHSWTNGIDVSKNMDTEQRWREIRDIIPLFIQVVTRYKTQSFSFLSACLPNLIELIVESLSEPSPLDDMTLIEECKLLRRSYLQLVQTICHYLPDAFFQLIHMNNIQNLSFMVQQLVACLESNDPLGLRSGVLIFAQFIQSVGHDARFYDEFLLPHFVPFCIITPTRPTFHLSDAQFNLVFNEMANCLHSLAQKQNGLVVFLRDYLTSQLQLSPEISQSYLTALKSPNSRDFHQFVKNFYAVFR